MDKQQISEIRARCEAATKYAVNKGKDVFLDNCLNDIPALLDEVERLTAELDALQRSQICPKDECSNSESLRFMVFPCSECRRRAKDLFAPRVSEADNG